MVYNYIRRCAEGVDRIRLLKATKNRGKGGAVRQGVLRARFVNVLLLAFFPSVYVCVCEALHSAS